MIFQHFPAWQNLEFWYRSTPTTTLQAFRKQCSIGILLEICRACKQYISVCMTTTWQSYVTPPMTPPLLKIVLSIVRHYHVFDGRLLNYKMFEFIHKPTNADIHYCGFELQVAGRFRLWRCSDLSEHVSTPVHRVIDPRIRVWEKCSLRPPPLCRHCFDFPVLTHIHHYIHALLLYTN